MDQITAMWFQEAIAILNTMGMRWGIRIYKQVNLTNDEFAWHVAIKNGVDLPYPSFSIAFKHFMEKFEERAVAYVKAVEYRD